MRFLARAKGFHAECNGKLEGRLSCKYLLRNEFIIENFIVDRVLTRGYRAMRQNAEGFIGDVTGKVVCPSISLSPSPSLLPKNEPRSEEPNTDQDDEETDETMTDAQRALQKFGMTYICISTCTLTISYLLI